MEICTSRFPNTYLGLVMPLLRASNIMGIPISKSLVLAERWTKLDASNPARSFTAPSTMSWPYPAGRNPEDDDTWNPYIIIVADNEGKEYGDILKHKQDFIEAALDTISNYKPDVKEELRKELKWDRKAVR
ncbi:hypothetical protein D9757_004480 [Collybiopsis confluens]|uniref:Uncharacterized protein n=1 Tax=Collybiopsis confluens TaxID=2823264 RepID=A0A8H5HX48_9AGAR|nr:hypothetical protein D9757_004480 [Collybiopsis confluens]